VRRLIAVVLVLTALLYLGNHEHGNYELAEERSLRS
jgi:hypothetical protein